MGLNFFKEIATISLELLGLLLELMLLQLFRLLRVFNHVLQYFSGGAKRPPRTP